MNKLASQLAYIISSNNKEYAELFSQFAQDFVSENEDKQFEILNERITKNCKDNKIFVRNLALILVKFYDIEIPDSLSKEIGDDKFWESGFISCVLFSLFLENDFGISSLLKEEHIPEHIREAVKYIEKHNYIVSLRKTNGK